MFKLLKKEDLKKLGNWFKLGSGSKGKSDLKAVIGTGAVKLLLDFIEELVQEAPNKAKLKGSGIGFLALAGTLLGLDTLEGKRTEANNNEKIRVKTEADKSEANKYESNCKAEADAYTQKRQADAELYEAKAKVDVWKAKSMNTLRSDEHQPNEEKQMDQEGSEDAFENDEPLPPIVQGNGFDLDFTSNRLFDKIIHRGDIGMFFGPKGIGKSIVSYWIALSVAEGKHITVWKDVESNPNPVPPTKVLYYDLELSPMDIHERFGQYGYEFPKNFIRHDKTQIKSQQDIIRDLRANVVQAKRGEDLFAVLDNIKKAMEITCAQTVKPFLNDLDTVVNIAKNKGVTLTVLIVNHPTKDFKPGDSLELGDAAGATDLRDYLNFVLAIEPIKLSRKHKILKVLNNRAGMEPENVAVVKLENKTPYTHPVVLCEMDEKKALNIDKKQFEAFLEGATVNPTSTDKRRVDKTGLTHEDKLEIYRLSKEDGLSQGKLAKKFGVSKPTIKKIVDRIDDELVQQGQQGT